MKRWVGTTSVALAALALCLTSCSEDEPSSSDDGANAGDGQTGGSGPSGGSSTGGSSTGGSSTGGSSTGGSSTGGSSTGGSSTGGNATGGSATGGSGGTLPPVDASCPEVAIFCESFEGSEQPNLEQWDIEPPWGQEKPEYLNYFTLETTTAADGEQSAHFRYGEEFDVLGAWAFLQTKAAIPAPDDRFYVRFYLRFADLSLSTAHPFYVSAFDARGQWDSFLGDEPMPILGFGSIRGNFNVGVLGNNLDNSQIWEGGAQTLRENEWFCVEMTLFGGGDQPDTEEVRVWVNGAEIADLYATDERWSDEADRWSPMYDGGRFRLGFNSSTSEREEYWLDAFVIAHEPIGCLP